MGGGGWGDGGLFDLETTMVSVLHKKNAIIYKSLGTPLRFWGVFQFTQVQHLPSPHKQCWTRVSRIFSEFQLCIGWGERELQENFEKDALF